MSIVRILAICALAGFSLGGGRLRASDPSLRTVRLEGSHYNRGLIHGRTLQKEIQEVVRLWKNDLERAYKTKPAEFIAQFLRKTDFIPAIKKWTPGLLDEVRGIADGSGVDFDTIFTLQLIDEQWANGGEVVAERCTSIGANRKGSNPTFVAQNMDIDRFYHGYQTLLRIKHEGSGLESFVFTCPGVIALNGLNSRAVAIACNTLIQLAHNRDGLPVAFIVRAVLEQRTFDDAVRFIHEVKHASGQNYIIGGPEKAGSFE